MMKSYGKNPSTDFEVYADSIQSLPELRASLDFPQSYFALLLACDASSLPDSQVRQIASELIDRGLVYLCAWGADCERVHDLFDAARRDHLDLPEDFVLMTTWHADESLDDALWVLLNMAMPNDEFWDSYASVAVSIGSDEWARQIDQRLSNMSEFSKEKVD